MRLHLRYRHTIQAYSPAKYEQLLTAIANAKNVASNASDETIAAARESLMIAYRSFHNDGLNKGGTFSGVIESNLTTQYLIETTGFSRSAGSGKRFGTHTFICDTCRSLPLCQ